MENDSRFYRIVYEYYEARILFGVCACGEKPVSYTHLDIWRRVFRCILSTGAC